MGATASSVGDRAAPGVQESSILYFETMEEDNFNTALRKSLLSMWRRRLSRKNRMSLLSVWRRLSDGTTELIPLRHQYIPNAKETPELACRPPEVRRKAGTRELSLFAAHPSPSPGFELVDVCLSALMRLDAMCACAICCVKR